jgi:prepilin-type N-terminal cleavage/methylation domain-containing protein
MKIKCDRWQVAEASDAWRVTCDQPVAASRITHHASRITFSSSPVTRHVRAFTLIELLVVISIMGLLAALAVPAIKNLGKSNIQVSASRQLLDDVGRARQLAISQHTTVYMVFVPTNFFSMNNAAGQSIQNGLNSMTPAADKLAAFTALTNLVDKQLSGYNFISLGKVGDQPGQHNWHYLADWKSLPEGTFVAAAKFQPAYAFSPMQISAWKNDYPNAGQIDNWRNSSVGPQIYAFTNAGPQMYIPFPTEKSPGVLMPCISFDSTGKLISEVELDQFGNFVKYHHAYIPLAQGTVSYGIDVNKKPVLSTVKSTDIVENPPGNSTSISYNIIDVDPLTGRAKLQHFKMP